MPTTFSLDSPAALGFLPRRGFSKVIRIHFNDYEEYNSFLDWWEENIKKHRLIRRTIPKMRMENNSYSFYSYISNKVPEDILTLLKLTWK